MEKLKCLCELIIVVMLISLLIMKYVIRVYVVGDNKIVVDNESSKLILFHFHTPAKHLIELETFSMSADYVHPDAKENLAVLGIKFAEDEMNRVLAE